MADNIVMFPKKIAPIKTGEASEWVTPLDCLKELVAHIESGRLPMPRMLYCAMQESNHDGERYPYYCWADNSENPVAHTGLLFQHAHNLCTRAAD